MKRPSWEYFNGTEWLPLETIIAEGGFSFAPPVDWTPLELIEGVQPMYYVRHKVTVPWWLRLLRWVGVL